MTSDASTGQEVDDDVVIDLTDETLARQALYDRLVSVAPDGELVIDLRDDVLDKIVELAPTGRRIIPPEHGASGRPPDLQEGLHVTVITGGQEWKQAEKFVYDTYLALGYTNESSREQVEELAKYEDCSRFHAAVRDDGSIVGTTRAIFAPFDQLPVGQFQRIDFSDEEPMCELSSIVVDPAARSKGVIEHLYREGWADAVRSGARTICGLGERWMIDGFRKIYCMPFVPCGIPRWYMGGEVIPMTMSTSVQAMVEVARANPEFWLWNLEALTAEEIDRLGFTDLAQLKLPAS